MSFALGQRWISDTETDLGLGTLVAIDGRMITMLFPSNGENRMYASEDAPITRVLFNVGDTVSSHEGWKMQVEEVIEQQGLITYVGIRQDTGESGTLRETFLDNFLTFNQPQERLFAGQIDRMKRFSLRYQALNHQHQQQKNELRGLVGGRVSLLPHQLHIAREVGRRRAPRVLLADEVGLGKTIEAGMIIHQQLLSGQSKRVLLLVPESLQHQWLIEMMRRFNLFFSIFDEERCIEALHDSDTPFDTEQLVLCSIEFFKKKRRRFEQALESEWDLLVIDEAHHLEWSEQQASREYQIAEALAEQTSGVLLLTATPEQLGHQSHFARLRLLDPERFYDYQAFVEQEQQFQTVANIATELLTEQQLGKEAAGQLLTLLDNPEATAAITLVSQAGEQSEAREQASRLLLDQLNDRHGTSRILFRNTRAGLSGFQTRHLNSYPLPLPEQYQTALRVAKMMSATQNQQDKLTQGLNPEKIFQQFEGDSASWCNFDPRVQQVLDLLLEDRERKVLLICSEAETALTISEALRVKEAIRCAVFHEDMSLIERDKAAAYFAQQEGGAQILLCSEIGSEGRNFQFAHHLVMFDLPLNPDLLEQRIGRLDRIGQTQPIQIHVPYLSGTSQETLLRWYHEGLGAFEQCCSTGSLIHAQVADALIEQLSAVAADEEAMQTLNQQTANLNQELKSKMEQGRDRLLELNSAGGQNARELSEAIATLDDDPTLANFTLRLYDEIGINQDDKGENQVVIKPGSHLLFPAYPSLPQDGTTITFERDTALSHEDVQFVSWEHPLIRNGLDLVLSHEFGTTSVALLKNPAIPAGSILLELIYVVEPVADSRLHRFLPATPIRLLLDKHGNNIGPQLSFDAFDCQLTPINRHLGGKLVKASQPVIHQLISGGEPVAAEQMQQLVEAAKQEMLNEFDHEEQRLQALKKINPSIRDNELEILLEEKQELLKMIEQTHLKMDAIRFVVSTPE
ncbi:RNA polymerase-associated protein RapA [Dongshaea marina]|uniref:RNA polymerase-associated protein RapA n=1 Tax=Dongshaea marina TaxID=2047966 RepID=UPI000D3EB4D8|nr:RNA polymerase-associated protein RapA [Dongshaea marina]